MAKRERLMRWARFWWWRLTRVERVAVEASEDTLEDSAAWW